MTDPRVRHQFQDRVDQTQSGPQHRNHHDVGGQLLSGGGFQRCVDADRMCVQIPGGFRRQDDADAMGQSTKQVIVRRRVAEGNQRVLRDRMWN